MSKRFKAPVLDMALEPMKPAVPVGGVMGIIERLASDPNFDTAKLEKLIELHERTQANAARAQFFEAFAEMQADIPSVLKTGQNTNTKAKYAKNHNIQSALRPVLVKYGFALNFRLAFPNPATLEVVGTLAHKAGHKEESTFQTPADGGAGRNAIQAIGSAQSYAQRYLTLALLNITTHEDAEDDDGQRAGTKAAPDAPKGFDDWFLDMESTAEEGTAPLEAAWKDSPSEFRRHLMATDKPAWETLKRKAAKVQA